VDGEEVDDALDEAKRTFDLLVSGRRASGDDAAL
jgi:hypothetical protein